jgi:hypothetical protein
MRAPVAARRCGGAVWCRVQVQWRGVWFHTDAVRLRVRNVTTQHHHWGLVHDAHLSFTAGKLRSDGWRVRLVRNW